MESNNGNKFSEILIVLFVVFFAVGAVIAYYIKTSEQRVSNVQIESTDIDGSNDKEKKVIDDVNKKNNTSTINEDNKNKDNDSELSKVLELKDYYKKVKKEYDSISCDIRSSADGKCEASKEVTVNSNTLNLKLGAEGISVWIEIFDNEYTFITSSVVYYKKVIGQDNKEYLLLWQSGLYGMPHVYLVNDSGKKLYEYDPYSDVNDPCFISVNEDDNVKVLDNNIYVYKYVIGSYIEYDYAQARLYKLTINNDKISEKPTGIIKDARCFH